MTIKELESMLSLDRASIRFYEKEGLISPARLANGYRDYSDADAAELRRIRLLRGLGVSIGDIRALQTGECALPDMLSARAGALHSEAAAAARAAKLCEALAQSRTEYAALDAAPYLSGLDGGIGSILPLPEDRDAVPEAYFCVFRRGFARALDLSLCALPVLWGPRAPSDGWDCALRALAAACIMLAAEPVLLHFWGWTPGKWICGLTLRDADGEKLTLPRAFRRTLSAMTLGLIGEAAAMDSYGFAEGVISRAMDGKYQPWDGDDCYTVDRARPVQRGVLGAALCALLLCAAGGL